MCHVSAKLRITTQAGGCRHKVAQCRTRQLRYALFSFALPVCRFAENYRYGLHDMSTKLEAYDNCYVMSRGHDCSLPTER